MENRIIKNASYLLISSILMRVFTATATILLARYLGPKEYGVLSIALAFSSIACFCTDLGLSHTLIREVTKPRTDLPSLLGSAIKIRLLFTLIISSLVLGLVYMLYSDPLVRNILLVVVMPMIWGNALQGVATSFFQGIQEMKYDAYIRTLSGLITGLTLYVGILLTWPLSYLALTYGVTSFGGAALSIWFLRRYTPDYTGWNKNVLQGLVPFALVGVIGYTLPQIGPLTLSAASNLTEVGYFSAAYRIPALLYQVPGVIAAAFYPALFELSARDIDKYNQLCIKELNYMSLVGFALALPFALYPDLFIFIILGPKWLGETPRVLEILAWLVALQATSFALGDTLTTRNLQQRRVFGYALGLTIGLPLYYVFVNRWGAMGAAFVSLIVEMILIVVFILASPSGVKNFLMGTKKPVISLIITMILWRLVYSYFTPVIGLLLVGITYLLTAICLDPELKDLVKSLQRKVAPNYFLKKENQGN